MHPRIILAIAKKDLLDAFKNAYILFALILPLGMSLLFSFIMPNAKAQEIVIFDAGQSRLVELIAQNKTYILHRAATAEAVEPRVKEGALGGLALTAGFDTAVASGKTPELVVYFNGDRATGELSAFRIFIEETLHALANQELPVKLTAVDVSGSGKTAEPVTFDLASFFLIMLLVMGLTMVGTFVVPTILVEEKEKGTLQAILTAPASEVDLVIGKALVGFIFSLMVALLLLALNQGFAGSPGVTLLVIILGSLFLVMVGLLMGALFSTITQVNTWSSLVMLALLVPAMFNLPPQPPAAVMMFSRFIPTGYMSHALGLSLGKQTSLGAVGLDLLILAGATVMAGAVVVWSLRRRRR